MPGEGIDNPVHDFGLVGGLNVDRDTPGLSGLVETPDLGEVQVHGAPDVAARLGARPRPPRRSCRRAAGEGNRPATGAGQAVGGGAVAATGGMRGSQVRRLSAQVDPELLVRAPAGASGAARTAGAGSQRWRC